MPRLSICIPTYNRAHLLPETVETILCQTYSDFELVIVDNNSTDNTEYVVRQMDDPRIRYVKNPVNVGLILNNNRCIEEAACELIAVYHDDDLYHPDIVRRSVELFDRYPSAGVVCTSMLQVEPDRPNQVVCEQIRDWDELMPGKAMRLELLSRWDCRIPHPTTMVRRACYEELGGAFRPEFGGATDREFWLRVFRTWDLAYIKDPMARLRDRPKGLPTNRYKAAEHAISHWEQLTSQIDIQQLHIALEYQDQPLQFAYQRVKLRWDAHRELWRWNLLMLAKGQNEVTCRAEAAFRKGGMPFSAEVARMLHSSSLARTLLARALVKYRGVARSAQGQA